LLRKTVKVKLKSEQQSIAEKSDRSLVIRLKSLPIDVKANKELLALLAQKFKIKKSRIKIKLGLSSRQKVIEIDDL